MKKIYKIIIGILIIVGIYLPSVVTADETFNTATCKRVDINFPNWHGYNCLENTGMIRGFLEPSAYENMNSYYTPALIEEYIPTTTYIYVTGGSTEGFN